MSRFAYFFLLISLIMLVSCSSEEQYETSSVYVTINDWTHKFPPGSTHTVPMTIMTRGKKGWKGEVKVMVKKGEEIINEVSGDMDVKKDTEEKLSLEIQLPEEEGTYEIVAQIEGHQGQPVKNRRLIEIDKPLNLSLDL